MLQRTRGQYERGRGFTLIELIIVLVVIVILVAISAFAVQRMLVLGRDAQRESKANIIAESLEKYHQKNGEYPSCPDMRNGTAIADRLEITHDTLITPTAPNATINSFSCGTIINNADIFAYEGNDSGTCANPDGACVWWTIHYLNEEEGATKSINSRQGSDIALNAPLLNISANGIDGASVSWTSLPNSSQYILQRSTSNSFAAPTQTTHTTTNTNVSGLSVDTTYYFRVSAIRFGVQGPWSPVVPFTTQAPPVAPPPFSMAITTAWDRISGTAAATCAPGSTLQYQWTLGGSYASSIGGGAASNATAIVGWGQNANLSVQARCTKAGFPDSPWTYANNNGASYGIAAPYIWQTSGYTSSTPPTFQAHFTGCPAYSTSQVTYIGINRTGTSPYTALISASGPSLIYTGMSGPFGDGSVIMRTVCTGPWGSRHVDAHHRFGAGCVPNITVAICTQYYI